MNPAIARRMWTVFEPLHALVYFAPEAKQAYADVGLRGGWMGYFASRSAALGEVPADVVVATFYNFAPSLVHRALPDAWRFSSVDRVLEARLTVADAALRRVLGDQAHGPAAAEAASVALRIAEAADPGGRPMFAAHAAQPVPDEPHLALWHAATCLREHRGDGHVAMLLTAAVDGCEANVLAAAAGTVPSDDQRVFRGWSPEEWESARRRLVDRGYLYPDGELTPGGIAARDSVEAQTEVLAVPPFTAVGEDAVAELLRLLTPLARQVVEAGAVPFPNAMGLPPI